MLNSKPAKTEFPVAELIANRWSPVGIDPEKPVSEEEVGSLLEAARWAPSSYNEQPWRYVVGYKGDERHGQLAECLVDGNAWAREAAVLMLSVAKLKFERNDKANHHAMHDVGAASVSMHLQATELGLAMHQMAGFEIDKARELFNIDETFQPVAMIAIGYERAAEQLADGLKERDLAPRQRKPHDELIWKS